MSLVDCAECKTQISERAIACPKCGCPRIGNQFASSKSNNIVHVSGVEFTSKYLKRLQLRAYLLFGLGALLFLGGFFLRLVLPSAINVQYAAAIPVVLGMLLEAYISWRKWWDHS